MIDAVFVLLRDSGLNLYHQDFRTPTESAESTADLFSGALQGIRLLLKECKIGELNEFTTHDHRTEIRFDDHIAVVITADLEDPTHEQLDMMTDDLLVLFSNTFKKEIVQFTGDVVGFEKFKKILTEYVEIQTTDKDSDESGSSKSDTLDKTLKKLVLKKTSGGLAPEINLIPLYDWLKNRFNSNVKIQVDVGLKTTPTDPNLPVSILADMGEKKLSFLDRWVASHVGKPHFQEIILIFGLNPSHGPNTIRKLLQQVQNMGDPAFSEDKSVFPWFPTEILFIGPGVQKSTFEGLEDVVKYYRDQFIIVPRYADHIHREHSPHHAFYRCKISGWHWKGPVVNAENYPQQIFPQSD